MTPVTEDLPQYLRAHGTVRLRCGMADRRSAVIDLRQQGALNIRFPRRISPELEAVIINIAGGVAAGDRYDLQVMVEAGAALTLSTAAAEKVYRSPGATSHLDVALDVKGRLDWLPQETILFDQARLARRLHISMADDAALLASEIMVLGRAAMGEKMATGLLRDEWRIRRDGRLVYTDILRLEGDLGTLLQRAAIADEATAFASMLYVAPDAEARLDEARALIDNLRSSACDVAASAWDGVLSLRWLAREAHALRVKAASFLEAFRQRPLPRVWMT